MIWYKAKSRALVEPVASLLMAMLYLILINLLMRATAHYGGTLAVILVTTLVVVAVQIDKANRIMLWPAAYVSFVLSSRSDYMRRSCPTCGCHIAMVGITPLMKAVGFKFACGYQVKEAYPPADTTIVEDCPLDTSNEEDVI